MIRAQNRTIASVLAVVSVCCITVIVPCLCERALALDAKRQPLQYGHDVWQRDQGLPHNTIHSIIQTQDGYIWLATDEGLTRFDGVSFKVIDSQNTRELGSNQIQCLFEDTKGRLWIGTTLGLTRRQNNRFTGFTTRDGLSDPAVSSICEDRSGNIWIGTASGLNRFADEKLTSYTTKDGLPNDSIRSLYEDRDGNLWISTLGGLARFNQNGFRAFTISDGLPSDNITSTYQDSKGNLWVSSLGGLTRFKDDRFTTLTRSNGLLNDRVSSIQEDRKGNLWVATDGGLFNLVDDSFKGYTVADGLPDNSVFSIYEDREGVLWLGTPGGLGRLKDGKITSYTTSDGLSDDVVVSVMEDREGSLWIGTEAGGLNRLRDVKFSNLSSKDGLTNDVVWAVCQGAGGSLWAGTNGGGLNQFRNGKFTAYTTKDGLPSNIVRALHEDRTGTLWAGTPGGLSRLRGGKITTYTVEDGLSSNAVWAIEEDKDGAIWVGTFGGLTRLKDGKFSVFTTRDGLSDDSVTALRAARGGGLWVGTKSGDLDKKEGDHFTSYRPRTSLVDDNVRAIYEDADGVVWMGTRRSGMSRFKDGTFTTFTTKAGLFDDCVLQIIEDDRHNLWMSSPRGVFRVSKEELSAFAEGRISNINCVSYDTSDGMLSRECNGGQPAGWRSADGKLWFPTLKGISMIDPQNMPFNQQPPPVAIERATVDGVEIELSNKVALAPGKERYEFYYTALSLIAPEKIRFKYRLEGYDSDWVDAGNGRVASYTHIPPGNYTFRVVACNNDGVWNEAGAAFDLYLKPYFYQTYWFYAVCVAVLGLMALGAYRLRVRRIRAQFAAVLEERNRMAREIHDTLAQGFVGIALQLQAVERALPTAPETAEQHLSLAKSMVTHSLNEARRTVWDLRSQALETNDLATALTDSAKTLTQGTSVVAEVVVHGSPRRLSAPVENNVFRIAQEALTNSLKHAEPNRVVIELDFKSSDLTLRVRDDGKGFDARSASSKVDGHFGLLGMRERVEHIGGTLAIDSRPGGGTEIVARIPIK